MDQVDHAWIDYKKTSAESRARHWVFTAWQMPSISALPAGVSYVGYGQETCPTTLKTHWQGYIEFEKQIRLSAVLALFKTIGVSKIWLGLRLGSPQKADEYCRKDGKHICFGTLSVVTSRQGERNDIQHLKDDIKSGKVTGFNGAVEAGLVSNVQHMKIVDRMLTQYEPKRNFKTKVIVHWGPSECGKSRYMLHECGNIDDVFFAGSGWPKWWPQYDGHPVVAIDDFRGSMMKFTDLLKMLDRYPYTVEFKGGHRQLLAKTIYITAPYHPRDWYPSKGEHLKQLLRRIDTIRYFYREVDESDDVSRIAFTSTSGEEPPLLAPHEPKQLQSNLDQKFGSEVEGNIASAGVASRLTKRAMPSCAGRPSTLDNIKNSDQEIEDLLAELA